MATVLSREAIFASKDTSIEFVSTPEWAPDHKDPEFGVFAKGLSGTDRDAFEMAMLEQRRNAKGKNVQVVNLKNLRAKLVVRGAVDSDDPDTCKPIFQPADIEPLGLKSASALNRVYMKIRELSGLSDEDVDELTAELGEDQSDASGSSSPSLLGIAASPSANVGSARTSSPSGSPTTDSNPLGTDD